MTSFWILITALLALALLFIILPLRRHLTTRSDYTVLILLCGLITCVALGFYLKQGSSTALYQTIALQQRAASLQVLLQEINHDPQKAIAMMKAYLQNKPNDKHGWYLLSKLYKSVGDSKEAQAAFKKSRGA